MRKTRKQVGRLLAASLSVVLAGGIFLPTVSAAAADLEANGKYYSNYKTYAELLESVGEINLQTAEEGQVLLKNDGSLPLNGNERVSVFGVASSTTVAGPDKNDAYFDATGFEVSDRGPIYDSLKSAGFKVNPTLADFYASKGFSNGSCGQETLDFTKSADGSVEMYDDVGVIVLARYGGEGADLAMITGEKQDGMYGTQASKYENDALYRGEPTGVSTSVGMNSSAYTPSTTSANYDESKDAYKHYLQLTDSEEALIEYVKGKCEKVVVVLNTSNAMECYDLREDEEINGILLMGRGGANGHMAVGEILAGLVNPSGGLVDEWNTDFTADPTWNNYAYNAQTGSQNMYYNGVFGEEGQIYPYKGNGSYDDHIDRAQEGDMVSTSPWGGSEEPATTISYGTHNQNAYYGTDYEEDIYLGYYYWETLYNSIYEGLLVNEEVVVPGNNNPETVKRGEGETVEAQAAAGAQAWWEANVTFEFGMGLSYTSFSFNIESDAIIAAGDAFKQADEKEFKDFDIATSMTKANLDSKAGSPAKIKTLYVPVTVTNTGKVAGKQTVELYATAPYNSESAKLEKAFVSLVGFEKTGILDPGESETVYVQINVQDIASYDYSNAYGNGTGYTLEAGNYTLRAMTSSHYAHGTDVADTTDAYDEVGFTIATDSQAADHGAARLVLDDFSGNPSEALFSDSFADSTKVSGNVWAEDTDADHYQVYNSLRTENLMADGTSKQVNLSRATMLTYFPQTPTEGDLTFSTSYMAHLDYWNNFSAADTESDEWYKSKDFIESMGWKQEQGVEDPETGMYSILLSDMSGKPLFKVDENGLNTNEMTDEWVEFMNQLTVEEMTRIIRKNYNMWRSTGLENIGKAANQQKDSYNNMGNSLLWVDAPTITATWNKSLAYDIGNVRGNISVFNGWSAWGGPEMDTHRSPFSGRNYEYFSSEGILGGYIAANVTKGIEDKGVTCYVKHFAFNDQETCRDGMQNMIWASEQTIRQIYLKVFQMAMQEGGSSSSMTGFARMSGIPNSSNNRLMEGLVEDQWGWTGFFITDGYSGNSRCATMSSMMRAYVVPLPLNSAIPMISGRYDKETNLFYSYTGGWDTEKEYKDADGNDIITTMYSDRVEPGKENEATGSNNVTTAKGYYVGDEIVSYTQWYYIRTLAAKILHVESNALTNLNGHSVTSLPTFTAEQLSFTQGTEVDLSFDLVGEAKNCFNEDGSINYDVEYTVEGDLPAGLSFSNGKLSGTPTEAGNSSFTVSVLIDGWVSSELVNDDRNYDGLGELTKTYNVTVANSFYLEDAEGKKVESTNVNVGDSFAAYIKSETVKASDEKTLEYSVKSGELPAGLELNKEEGTITGKIADTAKNGEYKVTVQVASKSAGQQGGNQGGGGFPGGPGGGFPGGGQQGGGSSATNYTYELTFVVAGAAEPVAPVYLTEAEVKAIVDAAIAAIPEADTLTEAEVKAIVDAAIKANNEENASNGGLLAGCTGSVSVAVGLVTLLAAAFVVTRKEN